MLHKRRFAHRYYPTAKSKTGEVRRMRKNFWRIFLRVLVQIAVILAVAVLLATNAC